jgi:hypothetical protein
VPYGAGVKMPKNSNKKIKVLLCLLFISLFAEIFLFNFRYFESLALHAPSQTINSSEFAQLDNSTLSDGGLAVTDTSSFVISPGVPVNSLKINQTGILSFTVDVTYIDENLSNTYIDAGQWTVDPKVPGSNYIRFITSGNCSKIKFSFSKMADFTTINSVELNRPYFGFNFLRFLLLFLILLFANRLRRRDLWEKTYDIDEMRQFNALCAIYIAAVLLTLLLYCGSSQSLETFSPIVGDNGDCYRLLTEAFRHGSLSYLEQPPQALKALANPYDVNARNFDYFFDSAFFHGKYYCYFGVTPVITLLLPFNLLTGLYMPTAFACMIYMIVMLLAAILLYYNIVELWFKDTGYMPFLSGAIVCVFGANLFWLIARPLYYELAVICALCYLFFGFTLLLATLRGVGKKPVMLCFSGLCFALMVASRPTFIFYLIAAVPLLYKIFVKTKGKNRFDLKNVAAFLTPLFVSAITLMAYNFARFCSPFDFGERYQLTVSNVQFDKVTNLAAIPGGLYHYLFQPLAVDLSYPFFHIVGASPDTSSGWYYNQPIAGIFNFPLLLILFASFYILKRIPKERYYERAFTTLLILATVVITWLDITLGGILERYSLDIGPMLVFVSLILWLEAFRYFQHKGAGVSAAKFFCTVCLVTAVISTFCCAVGEDANQMAANPALYHNISNALQFWR